MIAAQYSKDGFLIACDGVEYTLKEGEKKIFTLENIEIASNAADVKVFVWNKEFFEPVAAVH